MPRTLRYLRIAFTAACGFACILLSALWIRSYWRSDICAVAVSNSSFVGVGSSLGVFKACHADFPPGFFGGRWQFQSSPIVNRRDFQIRPSPRYRGALGFGIARDPTMLMLHVPHWFCIGVIGALATLPWIKSLRRFSLRTVLIVTTIVAAILGLIVAAAP
jgi:hypothetical protein